MLRISTTALVLTLLAAAGSLAAAAESAVGWQRDIDAALPAAAQTNRLVLVHFWRPSCEPCLRLDANVFSQPQFAAALEADYVPVKINTDQFPETARRYGVAMLPTDVILTPNGKVAATNSCPQDAAAYAQRLRETAAAIRRNGTQFAQADLSGIRADTTGASAANYAPNDNANHGDYAPSVGYRDATAAHADPANPRIAADGADRRYTHDFAHRRPTDAASTYDQRPSNDGRTATAAATTAAPRMTVRDVTPAGAKASAAGQPADTGLPYGNPGRLDTVGPPASEHDRAVASNASRADYPTGNNSAGNYHAADNYAAQRGYPTQMPAAPPPAASSAGQPSLCLDGHCPVTLMESQRWVYGDRRYGAIHRGRLYLFASADAQQRFLADPDRYSPAISGHDAVAWVEEGRLVPGERKFGGYYRNYIYLFASEAALRRFEANPDRYAEAVEQAITASRSQGQVRR